MNDAGPNGTNAKPFVNNNLVLQLIQILEQAKVGKIGNAIIVGVGPQGPTLTMVDGPGIGDIYLGLGVAQRRIETMTFPALFDQALNEAHQRRAMAQAIGNKGLILPNRGN